MKISLNEKDQKEMLRLFEQKDRNIQCSDLLNKYLTEGYTSITSDIIREKEKENSDEEECFEEAFLEYLDVDPNDDELKMMRRRNSFGSCKRMDYQSFSDNPYSKRIQIHDFSFGNWRLIDNYFAPYEGFLFDDIEADETNYYSEKSPLGFFNRKSPYLTVEENSQVWMSITPHEINTMREPIRKACGKVVTYGLGLGYFAYMCSLKKSVSRIDVIEKDNKVIRLFREIILPHFEYREKINIIPFDAFKYAEKKAPQEKYDYSFFDIYHSTEEALPLYLKMKAMEKLSPKTIHDYWIEDSILCLLRRYVITLLEENLNGYDKEDYQSVEEEDRLINSIYKAIENEEFKSFDEVMAFLSKDNMKKLAERIVL